MLQARFLDFKIQNFIATADLRFPIRLEALQQAHGQFASYEPELFPGLVYRMVRPRVVLLIFVNGKIVFTGMDVSIILHKSDSDDQWPASQVTYFRLYLLIFQLYFLILSNKNQ